VFQGSLAMALLGQWRRANFVAECTTSGTLSDTRGWPLGCWAGGASRLTDADGFWQPNSRTLSNKHSRSLSGLACPGQQRQQQ